MINEFINTYGMEILTTVITAIAGWIAVVAKKLITKYINDKTKQEIAKIVVSGIEQCYKTLDGPQKLEKALETASEMLSDKGIKVTEVELRMLLESALGEFNKVFEKEGNSKQVEDWTSEVLPEDSSKQNNNDSDEIPEG